MIGWISLLVSGLAAASSLPEFPDVKNPKHEIGYACLADIQKNKLNAPPGYNCGEPFKKFDKLGRRLADEYPPPSWAKKSDGKVLTRDDWKKFEVVMTGYEEDYGFKVFNTQADSVELRMVDKGKSEPVWVPKSKILDFFPLSESGICTMGGENWWQELYLEDLKTKAGLELDKVIPGEPFKQLEPIGVLELRRNKKAMLCKESECVSGKIGVDPKLFAQDEISQSRGTVKELTLGAEHFQGLRLERSTPEETREHLLVYDRRGEDEYYLKSDVYDSPKLWIKLKGAQASAVAYFPKSEMVAEKTLNSGLLNFPKHTQDLLRQTSVSVLETKWEESQLWFKLRIKIANRCSEPELAERSLGEYWTPFNSRLSICSKGC